MIISPFKLPKIDGDFAKWSEFKGIFELLVVDRQDLDVMSKYLPVFVNIAVWNHSRPHKEATNSSHYVFSNCLDILVKYYDNALNEVNIYLKELYMAKIISNCQPQERITDLRN